MKKQILILTFFIAAILAGTSSVFAQENVMLPGTAPKPLTGCAGVTGPLHPMAGVPYTYQVSDGGGAATATTWTWWATKNPVWITNGALTTTNELTTPTVLLGASGNYGSANTSDADTVSITWSPEILAATLYQGSTAAAGTAADPSPTFVVAVADGDCNNNMEVLEINPIPSFTVDIVNVESDGSSMDFFEDTTQCVSPVLSAQYNNTSKELTMDYGYDTLYFEIIAANFVTSWEPTFRVQTGFTSPQTAEFLLATSYANAVAGTPITGSTHTIVAGTAWTGPELGADASVASTVAGVSVWARVVIANGTFESLTQQDFVLSVDGQDATDQWDIDENNCSTSPITNVTVDYYDTATHHITPRPTLERNNTTDDGTIDPNVTIPKTPYNTGAF